MNPEMIAETNNALAILAHEPIRRMDGRHKDGFVEPHILENLISAGLAESFNRDGMAFVRTANVLKFAGHTLAEWLDAFVDMTEGESAFDIRANTGLSEERSADLALMSTAAQVFLKTTRYH